jgi:hypothetical protein
MPPEPISMAYFINSSHQSAVCVSPLSLLGKRSVKRSPPFVARQRLGKQVLATTNAQNNKITFGRVILYAVRVLSKKSLWVCLPLLFLGKKSVKTFPW